MSNERAHDNETPDYDEEMDRYFDQYLRTAKDRSDFAIPKMRITRPSEMSDQLRSELVETMRKAQEERQLRERIIKCRSFGDFFKHLKQARNLNWKRIAEYLNTSIEDVGKIERNELHPADLPFQLHKALATLFDIPAEYYIRMMTNLLLVEAEHSASNSGLQFARRDVKAKQDREELLEAWCTSASSSERAALQRFKGLIHTLEKEMPESGMET